MCYRKDRLQSMIIVSANNDTLNVLVLIKTFFANIFPDSSLKKSRDDFGYNVQGK